MNKEIDANYGQQTISVKFQISCEEVHQDHHRHKYHM